LSVWPVPATMSVVSNLLAEHFHINKTCRKFAALLLGFLTITFCHTGRVVRGFSRVLDWSLCKDIPSLFNDTDHTIWNPQLFVVKIENTRFPLVFLKRKSKNRDPPCEHVLSCFQLPLLSLFIPENRSKPKSRPTYSLSEEFII
jgi:hypothetical protein